MGYGAKRMDRHFRKRRPALGSAGTPDLTHIKADFKQLDIFGSVMVLDNAGNNEPCE
jgi:hypothetical protein